MSVDHVSLLASISAIVYLFNYRIIIDIICNGNCFLLLFTILTESPMKIPEIARVLTSGHGIKTKFTCSFYTRKIYTKIRKSDGVIVPHCWRRDFHHEHGFPESNVLVDVGELRFVWSPVQRLRKASGRKASVLNASVYLIGQFEKLYGGRKNTSGHLGTNLNLDSFVRPERLGNFVKTVRFFFRRFWFASIWMLIKSITRTRVRFRVRFRVSFQSFQKRHFCSTATRPVDKAITVIMSTGKASFQSCEFIWVETEMTWLDNS